MKWYIPQLDKYLGGVGITILGASALLVLLACLALVSALVATNSSLSVREAARASVNWTMVTIAFIALSWVVGEMIAGAIGRR